jgi:uncharacterized protein YggE
MAEGKGILFISVLGVLILAIILAIGAINRPNQYMDKTISVSGEYTKSVAPNEAKIFIQIQTLNMDAAKSKNENAKLSNEAIAALKDAGVKDSEIETATFTITRKEDWNQKDQENDFKGYQVTNVLKLTTANLDKVGDYIDAAVNNGANGINQVIFDLSEERQNEVKSQALAAASQNAKVKADAISKSLNIKLGKIKTVSESIYYQPYNYYAYDMKAAGASESATSISPQNVDVGANVNVAYGIR